MKPKTVLIVAVAVACIGDVVAQGRRLSRPSDWRVVQSVENELKDVWAEPEEDFKQLTDRAMKDDPQALYALSQVCKEKELPYRTWSKYLNRSADLGYAKAQLRLALDRFCEGSFRGDTNELQNVKAYCTCAINTGYLCVTNLIPLVDRAIRKREEADREEKRKRDEREHMERKLKEAEHECDQRLQANGCARQNKERAKIPGVTAPLVPFEEKDKIPYEDAVERARKNDPGAYYWLAYYFTRGEGVKKDEVVAGKFLQKAVDFGHAKASCLMGVFYERFALTDENGACVRRGRVLLNRGSSGLLSDEDIDEMDNVLAGCHFSLKRPASVGNRDSMCYTNDVVTGYVMGLYSTAARGGLSYATNCIARLNSTIVKCRERIAAKAAAENAAKARASVALSLLVDEDEKKRGEEENGEKLRRKQEEQKQKKERDCQKEYWSTWPRDLSNEEYGHLLCDAEKKYNSVILGLEYLLNKKCASSTNTWNVGCGRSLVKCDECFVRKIDKEGRVVWLGGSERANDVEEIRWYSNERSRLLEGKRAKWAEEHGMTVEEVMCKYDEWLRQPCSSELEKSRRQLLLIQEELRKAREARQVQENQ